jgi:hypothetical protein
MFGNSGGEGACGPVLNLNAGWEADTYIHAIERPEGDVSSYFEGGGGFVQRRFSGDTFADTKTSNFSMQGLFLGVNVSWM